MTTRIPGPTCRNCGLQFASLYDGTSAEITEARRIYDSHGPLCPRRGQRPEARYTAPMFADEPQPLQSPVDAPGSPYSPERGEPPVIDDRDPVRLACNHYVTPEAADQPCHRCAHPDQLHHTYHSCLDATVYALTDCQACAYETRRAALADQPAPVETPADALTATESPVTTEDGPPAPGEWAAACKRFFQTGRKEDERRADELARRHNAALRLQLSATSGAPARRPRRAQPAPALWPEPARLPNGEPASMIDFHGTEYTQPALFE